MPNELLSHVQPCADADTGTSALDPRDPADELGAGYGGVVPARAVSASDENFLARASGPGHRAMDNQLAFPRENHNISREDFAHTRWFHQDQVTRPDRRHHADARHPQANAPESSSRLRRQIATECVRRFHESVQNYETFRFARQEACVPLTLPHESADTSKTCSKRKAGAS